MAPRAEYEFVILRLSFFPYEHPENPRIYMQRRYHSPSASMSHIREWYARVLFKETSRVPPNHSISYCEWFISSSDATLFMVDGHRFDSILLILGEEMAHWVYYKNMSLRKRVEGSAHLLVSYCSCCIDAQYLNIMDAVKGCVNQRGVYQ